MLLVKNARLFHIKILKRLLQRLQIEGSPKTWTYNQYQNVGKWSKNQIFKKITCISWKRDLLKMMSTSFWSKLTSLSSSWRKSVFHNPLPLVDVNFSQQTPSPPLKNMHVCMTQKCASVNMYMTKEVGDDLGVCILNLQRIQNHISFLLYVTTLLSLVAIGIIVVEIKCF